MALGLDGERECATDVTAVNGDRRLQRLGARAQRSVAPRPPDLVAGAGHGERRPGALVVDRTRTLERARGLVGMHGHQKGLSAAAATRLTAPHSTAYANERRHTRSAARPRKSALGAIPTSSTSPCWTR